MFMTLEARGRMAGWEWVTTKRNWIKSSLPLRLTQLWLEPRKPGATTGTENHQEESLGKKRKQKGAIG